MTINLLADFEIFVWIIAISTLLFSLDDLFIDCIAYIKKLKPLYLSDDLLASMFEKKESNIAILVANWKEHEVIEKMISGNIRRLQYSNYHFFIGVYPNDEETVYVAKSLSEKFQNVHMIENFIPGPTSKGQLLNFMAREIIRMEPSLNIEFDLFLLHDSEDSIHPQSLKLINYFRSSADFLQIPVFSFNLPLHQFVGATYLDEFSELHTKDLLVREYMGASIPSAGVGTAIGRQMLLKLISQQDGNFLVESSLTEDYILGASTNSLGFKSKFLCYRHPDDPKNFIATKEYFPRSFYNSVKQKTRWAIGIVFQSSRVLHWRGTWADKYFFLRDRRGPINHFLAASGILLLLSFAIFQITETPLPTSLQSTFFQVIISCSIFCLLNRLLQKFIAVFRVGGLSQILSLPIRWPVAVIINFSAGMRAYYQFFNHLQFGTKLKWSKTVHELPLGFGEEVAQ